MNRQIKTETSILNVHTVCKPLETHIDTCEECDSEVDIENDEIICQDCGLVQDSLYKAQQEIAKFVMWKENTPEYMRFPTNLEKAEWSDTKIEWRHVTWEKPLWKRWRN
jgi:transcription initiation factor TFIIIB Brf1 subunit/transcription initiation factor TFIIB